MNHPITIPARIGKKASALIFIAFIAVGAFATLGDGKRNNTPSKNLSLSHQSTAPGTFSLKSGYTYRGSMIFNGTTPAHKLVSLNTTVTLQKGNITYSIPLKKSVILDKVKIDLGNRQFQRN